LNNHYNRGYSQNSGGSYKKEILLKCLGIGYAFSSRTSIDFSYYWTSTKDFAYYRETDWLTYSKIVVRQIEGIFKFGINISLVSF
jgi:hypothetical protein